MGPALGVYLLLNVMYENLLTLSRHRSNHQRLPVLLKSRLEIQFLAHDNLRCRLLHSQFLLRP